MQPNVQAFFDLATSTVSYLVSDPATKVSAIIDPVLDFEPKAARLSTSSADLILAAVADRGAPLAGTSGIWTGMRHRALTLGTRSACSVGLVSFCRRRKCAAQRCTSAVDTRAALGVMVTLSQVSAAMCSS